MASLEEENRLQAEKEKLRSSLLRSISHDLRTPLTGIAGGADLLLSNFNEINPETMKSVLNDISSDAFWLSGMVENLLNMTRIQDGRLVIKKNCEVVDDIIGEAVSKIIKQKKDHKLIVEKADEMLLVPMDGRLIIQVLINLIDNSFKHTRDDSSVWVKVYRESENAVFEIADNGGGIREDKIDKLFNSYYTVDDNNSDKKLGIGLGLNICKSIVEAHGGKITAENNSIGGASFKFYLPEVKVK
ncbi:MAG TPA: ATP-binding protein [Oscillospiraceae bacterium]|nr:ATP-binding protein [Oscillospiraceae bacterium]HPS35696.1 ATP-binding protein [Oscillospiraceae bacterium]